MPHSLLSIYTLVALRVYMGAIFIFHGWAKVQRGPSFTEGMVGFLDKNASAAYDFYWPFIENLVLPNKGLFALMVAYGELAMGVALVLGFMTRWAALAGVFLMLNFWFAKGIPVAEFASAQQHDIAFFFVFLLLAFSRAGANFGLDGRWSERWAFLR